MKDDLDEIKQFAAGVARAEKLSTDYTLASYYPFMFAFQQYFHSSFRARQGKVLEKMVQSILKKYGKCDSVPDSRYTKIGSQFWVKIYRRIGTSKP